MATHSSVLAWRIPGTAESDGLPSMGSLILSVPLSMPQKLNSSVATSFTYAFGRAVNEVCYKTASRMAKGEKVDITSAFAMDVIMKLIQKYYKKEA